MARQISEIKNEMTSNFVNQPVIIERYGLDPEKGFDEQFSRVSLESMLFYVVSVSIWVLEKLFDRHREEVNRDIDNFKPHSLRWYVNKAKQFRVGEQLLPDSDKYSDIGPYGVPYTPDQIETMQVVKYAAANELTGVVYLKIAGGDEKERKPLSDDHKNGVEEYMAEIKDAGVRLVVWSKSADVMRVNLTVHYNPMILNGEGSSLTSGGNPVIDCIKKYLATLPFNGEHRNVSLVDELQKVPGVVIPELYEVNTRFSGEERYKTVDTKETPYSGYYDFDEKGSQINYVSYESVSD